MLAHSAGVRQLLESQAAQIVGDAVDLVLARHASGLAHGKTGPTPIRDELKKGLLAGLERAKGEVPTVSLVFKGVNYEQKQSPDFHDRVRKAVPGAVLKRLGKWHDQGQAVKQRMA